MSVLSDILSPLDWARESAVGAGEGLMGLLGGDFSGRNALKILPAALGAGAGLLTGGAAAAPVGALAASLLQGAGKSAAPETFHSRSTEDILRELGGDPDSFVQNLALGAATDPWTYTGFGLGKHFGEKVGARAAEGLAARAEDAYHAANPAMRGTEDLIAAGERFRAKAFPAESQMFPGWHAGDFPSAIDNAAERARTVRVEALKGIDPLAYEDAFDEALRVGVRPPDMIEHLHGHELPAVSVLDTDPVTGRRILEQYVGKHRFGNWVDSLPRDVTGAEAMARPAINSALAESPDEVVRALAKMTGEDGAHLVAADRLEESGDPLAQLLREGSPHPIGPHGLPDTASTRIASEPNSLEWWLRQQAAQQTPLTPEIARLNHPDLMATGGLTMADNLIRTPDILRQRFGLPADAAEGLAASNHEYRSILDMLGMATEDATNRLGDSALSASLRDIPAASEFLSAGEYGGVPNAKLATPRGGVVKLVAPDPFMDAFDPAQAQNVWKALRLTPDAPLPPGLMQRIAPAAGRHAGGALGTAPAPLLRALYAGGQ